MRGKISVFVVDIMEYPFCLYKNKKAAVSDFLTFSTGFSTFKSGLLTKIMSTNVNTKSITRKKTFENREILLAFAEHVNGKRNDKKLTGFYNL